MKQVQRTEQRGRWASGHCNPAKHMGTDSPGLGRAWHRDPKGIQAGMEWGLSLVLVRHHGIKEYKRQAQHRDLNPLAFGLKAFGHSVVIFHQAITSLVAFSGSFGGF